MKQWTRVILDVLPSDGRPMARNDLEVLCAQRLAIVLDRAAFDAALAHLCQQMHVDQDARSCRRIEPDFDEALLERSVENFLGSDPCLEMLAIKPDAFVLQNTTTVGAPGAGRWSRPDFTLAAIRSFRYDPRRYLDVFSFELKNRAGTNVPAAHEALAHARFSHYSFLVCPRSTLRAATVNQVRQACVDHGVGLITFDLAVSDDSTPVLDKFQFDANAARRTPEPANVDVQLDSRLSPQNQAKLLKMATQS